MRQNFLWKSKMVYPTWLGCFFSYSLNIRIFMHEKVLPWKMKLSQDFLLCAVEFY